MSGRRIEGNFNQGWGFAAFITLLALSGYALAYTINRHSNRSPSDVMAPAASAETH